VGTAKRERQKANRQLRLEELAKQARKDKSKRLGLRIALLVGAVVILVGGISLFGGDDESTTATTTTVAVVTTTIDPNITTTIDPNIPTTTAPPKPDISIPAEQPVTALKVTTITEGTGVGAVVGDTIEVHYLGYTSADGVEFDNSYDRGAPIPVVLGANSVIDGWEQGLLGLKVGGRYQLDIPEDLAYGPDAAAQGRPAGALSFIVDVMSITPAVPVTVTT
jgi:peptidylprolyl isomerase